MDIEQIRADFPALNQEINGHPLVYLDNAATTQKPRQVIQSLVDFYEQDNANIHRGIHTLATRATQKYEAVRPAVATFLGTGEASSIVFTRNATEALNLLAHAWGDSNVGEGDEIVLTTMEHHSNIVPWQLLARRRRAVLRYVDVDEHGELDLDGLRSLVNPKTRAICVTQASNVLGTINPVEEIAEIARTVGARLFVDGAQSAPHIPLRVEDLGCDAFAFSAHKMLGPTGVGVLWARPELLMDMEPFLGGGDMISIVREEGSSWADLPYKFEAGTPNIADVVAFKPALDYLAEIGMDAVREHEIALTAHALDRLATVPGLTLFGPPDPERRTGVVSFATEWGHPHDLATILDTYGVAVRAGHHCAQPLMRCLRQPATTRASFYLYNTETEIDVLRDALLSAQAVLGGEA